LGGKFVGYTTRAADGGSVDVLNPLFVQYLLPVTSNMRLGDDSMPRLSSRLRPG
jgi:hypothetical protein